MAPLKTVVFVFVAEPLQSAAFGCLELLLVFAVKARHFGCLLMPGIGLMRLELRRENIKILLMTYDNNVMIISTLF